MLTSSSRIKEGNRWIDTPIAEIFQGMADSLKQAYAYQSGASWAGGYFLLEDILVTDAEDVHQYLDIALFASVHEMNDEVFARLKELNETEGEKCCWTGSDSGAGPDVSSWVNGLVRLVLYEKDPNTGLVSHALALYEGEYYRGELEGFGRLLFDLPEGMAHYRENAIGYFAGDGIRMNGRTLYWSDGELVYSGEQYGVYRDVSTVTEYEFDSFVASGDLEEDEDFEQWQAEQRALAEEQALLFGMAMMSSPVQYAKYNWDETSAAYRYLTDRELGGGPVSEVNINGVEIETPLLGMWEDLGERLAQAYVHEQGASWAGGTFVLRDLKLNEENEERMWWDLTLLTDPDAMDQDIYEALKAMNGTSGEKCCMDGPRASDGLELKNLLTGLVRAVTYTKDADGENTRVEVVYEGAVRRGEIHGFGRMIRDTSDGTADSFIGWSDGWEAAAGRYVYYRDFQLLY